jgi:hypothetical protein
MSCGIAPRKFRPLPNKFCSLTFHVMLNLSRIQGLKLKCGSSPSTDLPTPPMYARIHVPWPRLWPLTCSRTPPSTRDKPPMFKPWQMSPGNHASSQPCKAGSLPRSQVLTSLRSQPFPLSLALEQNSDEPLPKVRDLNVFSDVKMFVMNAKDPSVQQRRWRRTTVGQTALLQRGSAAELPLSGGHPQISGPGGQRLVSVIQ